ncbi:sugar transferase [Ruminococcus sp.]|uniref:sugar transferase n=1 Tax=Ruminococcus sp. TaxID=41978 RepID=UPI0025E0B5EB|nr:sugar transferase [Ruminococcus sp.]
MYNKIIKRFLDIVLSGAAIICLSPVFFVVAILIRINLGSPVLFTQERPGLIDPKTGKEKIFKLYKFRSMTNETDENGELLPKEKRLTKFGKKLRSTSLDELPELFNIIRGDMSIVGPRPLLVKYLPLYNEHQRKRHLVRPGLTGYAQANGRNLISWEQKFDMDVKYAENVSFKMDLGIILKTIKTVLKREGIGNAEACVIAEFKGSDNNDDN